MKKRVIGAVNRVPPRSGTVSLLRPRTASKDYSYRKWPDWMWDVPSDDDATLDRARYEAKEKLKLGADIIWVCRSRHKNSGVIGYRFFTLDMDTLRILGGRTSQVVIEIHDANGVHIPGERDG